MGDGQICLITGQWLERAALAFVTSGWLNPRALHRCLLLGAGRQEKSQQSLRRLQMN